MTVGLVATSLKVQFPSEVGRWLVDKDTNLTLMDMQELVNKAVAVAMKG